ncbi:MAG: sel1 repeat family protein [Lachnospiraceae bacterium]|jgi:TPR repeat protein|nr:sel1 repeat family protein [Lachnospiraceae bacterium]
MKNASTYLRILNSCLSGRGKKIFPNQVIFYNAIFAATNPALLPQEYLADMERVSRGDRQPRDDELIRRVNYLLRNGLDSNSANVGKHINNAPEMPIPRQHKAQYLDDENRKEIVLRLQAVIDFCLAFHPGRLKMGQAEFGELLVRLKEELGEASRTLSQADELSVELLGNIIYEILVSHLSMLQEHFYPLPDGDSRVKVDLQKQREEYLALVDVYGNGNVDRFFAMKRLAKKNVIAANELACIYYFGARYYETDEGDGNTGIYVVEPDRDQAAFYFKKAANCEPPVLASCWSLGYMIANRMFSDIEEEKADELACSYYSYAMEQGYLPAFNNMGQMELARGDALLKQAGERESQGEPISEEIREEILSHYCEGLRLCDKAGCLGWVYGHINVANFLADSRYQTIWEEIKDRVRLQGPCILRERWKAAADLDNLWAMNQLAMYDCRHGDIQSAVEMWEEAARRHFPAASLNLALYVYGPRAPRDNRMQYQECLERASADGSARGSYELARLYVKEDPFMARMLLSRAEEQNYKKFSRDVYHRIRNLNSVMESLL